MACNSCRGSVAPGGNVLSCGLVTKISCVFFYLTPTRAVHGTEMEGVTSAA